MSDYFGLINSLAAFLISAVFAGILIPQILLIAFRKNLFDVPDERKIHFSSVPRLGGVAFEPVVFFCLFVLLLVNSHIGNGGVQQSFHVNAIKLYSGACSLILMYIIGIADDLIGVKYRAKFVMQILCGVLFVSADIGIFDLHGFLGIHELPYVLGVLLSIVLIVFIVNSMNLIDGIDGLASGLSAVALGYYGVLFLMLNQYAYALLAFSTLGTVCPFFYYNVFGKAEKQKKIFMGDTGSLTIGIILSFLCLNMAEETSLSSISEKYNPLVVAFAPLMIPCMDVVRVFFHRIKNRQSPFLPDKNHIHHKLLRLGFSQRRTMIMIIIGSIVCTALCVFLSMYLNSVVILLLAVAIFTLVNIRWTNKISKQENCPIIEKSNS